jgi:hypothetical protein
MTEAEIKALDITDFNVIQVVITNFLSKPAASA